MPFFIKSNGLLKNSNFYIKNSNLLKDTKNIWVKEYGDTGNLRPIWSYYYDVGAWGACSVTCGGGWQYRSVICKRNDGVIKDNKFCSDIQKPVDAQMCNTQSCYWASAMQFHYGRHNTGDTRQLVGNMGPGTVSFSVYVTDMCNKGTAWLTLEKINETTGARTEIWRSENVVRGVCDNWDEQHIGNYSVYVNEPARLEFRAFIEGKNNCCRSIIVRNIHQ